MLCVLLVAAPLALTAGAQGEGIPKTVHAVPGDAAGPELSVDSPSDLAAILALRQVGTVEAKRLLPDSPPPPALVRQNAVPGTVLSHDRAAPWPYRAVHAGLLASNRIPTGPPLI